MKLPSVDAFQQSAGTYNSLIRGFVMLRRDSLYCLQQRRWATAGRCVQRSLTMAMKIGWGVSEVSRYCSYHNFKI
jgi:hypothetical protein